MRVDWTALPAAVTTEITDRIGEPHVVPAVTGDHAEIAATVHGTRGTVFVKAACIEFGVRTLRYELRVSEAVSRSYSPAVRWQFEEAGWLVAGFEHCDGPHADLSPGSPHLDLLGKALTELSRTPAPDLPLLTAEARLGFELPAADGDTLVHTDLGPANLIVTPAGLRIVDWAMTTKAAPWVELAMLTPWLIGAGHTPEQADRWLSRHPAWQATDATVLDDFAARNAAKWQAKSAGATAPWIHDLADRTSRWAAYRRTTNRSA